MLKLLMNFGGKRMNRVLRWILYVLLGLVVLAIIAGIVFSFLGFGRGYVMMRPGYRMMGPYVYTTTMHPLGAIFGGLIGLGIFILIIVGIVALVNAAFRGNRPYQSPPPAQPAAPARTCPNCGKPAMEDWKTCPYCGNPLT